jgi:chromosome segregation ATPase
MKREDLTKLFLTEGQTELTDAQKAAIDKIMALNGQDVEKAKGDASKLQADLDAAQADIKAKQEQIDAAAAKIKEFEDKGLDIEAVRTKAAEYEADAKKAREDAAAQLQQVRFGHALERDLAAAKAKNPTAARALLNMDGLKYDEKADKVIGLEDQLKAIREKDGYLFEVEQTQEEAPTTPPPSATAGVTPPRKTDPLSFLERTIKAANLEAEKGK